MSKDPKQEPAALRSFDPMNGFYDLWRSLDYHRHSVNFMNYNVRGSFVTVYMLPKPLEFYVNLLHEKGYTCFETRRWAIDRGYPEMNYYCRIGPYQVRLALHREKEVKA